MLLPGGEGVLRAGEGVEWFAGQQPLLPVMLLRKSYVAPQLERSRTPKFTFWW